MDRVSERVSEFAVHSHNPFITLRVFTDYKRKYIYIYLQNLIRT